MVEVETRMGPKGQILIPKVFREEYNILPGDEVIIKEIEEGILIEKNIDDSVKFLEDISRKSKKSKKIDFHGYEEQIEARWKRIKK